MKIDEKKMDRLQNYFEKKINEKMQNNYVVELFCSFRSFLVMKKQFGLYEMYSMHVPCSFFIQ